jgi:hypothetical protein
LLAAAREELREEPGRRVLSLSRRRDRQHDRLTDFLHAEVEERAAAALEVDNRSNLACRFEAIRQAQLSAF